MTPMFNKTCLIKLKYTTIDKHLIATGYSNFLAQFSVSLNNIMCAYISYCYYYIIIIIPYYYLDYRLLP